MSEQPKGRFWIIIFVLWLLFGVYMHQEGHVLPAGSWSEFKAQYAPKPYRR